MQNYTKQCPTKIKTGRKYLVLWHKGEVLVMSESRLAVGSKDTNSQEDSITSTVNFFLFPLRRLLNSVQQLRRKHINFLTIFLTLERDYCVNIH